MVEQASLDIGITVPQNRNLELLYFTKYRELGIIEGGSQD